MQSIHVSAVLAFLAAAAPVAAQPSPDEPPALGVCQPLGTDSIGAVTKVSWTFDQSSEEGTAKITTNYGDEYDGAVIGMRPHIDWFKFSIRYTDMFDNLNELTIFHALGDYRMGNVSFDLLDGEKYVSSISPFEAAQCLVQ